MEYTNLHDLLKYAQKLDDSGDYVRSEQLTDAMIPDYTQMACDRLRKPYPQYEKWQYLSEHYDDIANLAFSTFLKDIYNLDPELMEYFNQDEDYNDFPDYDELSETERGKSELRGIAGTGGWQPPMASKNDDFMIYPFVLRLLERAGVEVPNHYISEDVNFRIEDLLKKPKAMSKFVDEIAKLPHTTVIEKFMPEKYMADASIEYIKKFYAGNGIRRKKKIG